MNSNKYIFLKSSVVCLIIISFFLGYFLRENSAGGGAEFYRLSWPIIQSLKKDFLFTIKNYASFGDATIPFSHIINAFLNPFSDNLAEFQLSVTLISFFIFFVFAVILKKNFSNINFTDIFLTSSIILLLPFYRTSAFWGKNENYGWLFLILAFYFFFEIKKNLSKIPENKDIFNIVFFCLTSACALYARQSFVFLPISYLFYLFFNKANKKIIAISIISFAIFSVPGFLLIFYWGNIFNFINFFSAYGANNLSSNELVGLWVNPKYIFKSLPIILSFFGFYLLPVLIIEFLSSGFKDFFGKYYKSFFFSLIFYIFLMQTNYLNYLANYEMAGGAVLKLNYLIQKNNYLLLLIFSSIGFSILTRLFAENVKNNIIILLPILIIYGCRNPALQYQEYYEPLILITFFLGIQTNLHKIYFKNILLSNTIFISYFVIYLIGSIYFKHFAFGSFEEWKIFLESN